MFKAYSFTDGTVENAGVKEGIQWYIKNAVENKKHSFVMTLELLKGNTYRVSGLVANSDYVVVTVSSYTLPKPLYGTCFGGTWTWT